MGNSSNSGSNHQGNSELKKRLSSLEYRVTQEKGTERAFSGKYWNNKKNGEYMCIVCNELLFSSKTKFDSGTGWPSFYQCESDKCEEETDITYGMKRTEVHCKKCKAHLGHVFDDGPEPTGLRYCINSASLTFKENT